jgi:hypothetical protein
MTASRAIVGVALSIAMLACSSSEGPCGAGAACPGVGMYWASYQMNAEPHYRLIFEGGTEQMTFTELRIRDASGAIVASATVVPAEEEALRLCGGGIPKGVPVATPVPTYRPGLFGAARATVPASESVFRAFINDAAKFRVEILTGPTWMPVIPTNLCHAQE